MQILRREKDYDGINMKVAAEFTCHHTETTRCKKVKSNHDFEIRNQCKKCGSQIGHAIRKATLTDQEVDVLPQWDDHLGAHFAAERNKRHTTLSDQDEERIDAEWNHQYQEYRKTPEWLGKRQLVMLRAQGICEGCRSSSATQVHHLSYAHVGDEFLFELVAVCRKCHEKIHSPTSVPHAAPKLAGSI